MGVSDHKREIRTREISDDHCAEPNCEFYGKSRQQGVCFSQPDDARDWDRIFEASKQHSDEMLAIRRSEFADKPSEYIEYLEAMYECAMMNWGSTLDECICLRVENRRLKERNP